MATLTPKLSLRKAQDSDNARTYLVTDLGATLDILDEAVTLTGVQTLTNKTISAPTITGNLTFSGTGQRIVGLLDGFPAANRVLFQTSTANAPTTIAAIPNGTSRTASLTVFNSSDPDNAGYAQLQITDTVATVRAAITGTGSYVPLTFETGGAERMRIDTGGIIYVTSSLAPASSTTAGALTGKRITFMQAAGDEVSSGQIDYGQYDTGALSIVGKGTTNTNRTVRIYDKLAVSSGVNQSAHITLPAGGKIHLPDAYSAIGYVSGGTAFNGLERGIHFVNDGTYGQVVFTAHRAGYNPMFTFRASDDASVVWLRLDLAGATGDTVMHVAWYNGTNYVLQRVTVGAPDSGGTGYRVLRIPN